MRFILVVLMIRSAAWAQTVPAGDVLGPGNFLHIVADAEKAIDFYENVLGMDLQRPAGGAAVVTPRPYLTTPEIQSLYNAPGIPYRVATGMINESPMRAELVEWNDPAKKAIHPRIQDPGAAKMIMSVRNLDAIMARVRRAGTPVLTSGGAPLTFEGAAARKVVLLQDPDGFFVELRQPMPVPLAGTQASNNIYKIDFGVTVSDMDKMLPVFRDALGFDPKLEAWSQDELVNNVAGLPAAEFRRATALVPGSNLEIEFTEFRNVNRKVNESAPRDPGTPILRLRIKEMEATLGKLFALGVKVASKDGEAVTLTNPNGSQRAAILRGPDNLMIQLLQAVPKTN